MKVIEESLDRLIQRIKLTNEILDSENQIRFIKAYKEQYMESPVSGFLVAVGLDDLQINNNFIGDFV